MSFEESLKDVPRILPVRGLPVSSDGHPGIRLELRELKKNADLWTLYLLGLAEFQKLPQDHFLSYFQIAGIHGMPHTEWPLGDENLKAINPEGGVGFCTHSSILFLTWHRPYLALFEFILFRAVNYVAEQFDEHEGRARYVKLAKDFRMPYWDWARPDLPVFPDEAVDELYIKIKMPAKLRKRYGLDPQAEVVSILNPLYAYHFQRETAKDIKVLNYMSTRRWEIPLKEGEVGIPEGASAEQIKERMYAKMKPYSREYRETLKAERNLRERIVYILQSYNKFDQVSNNKYNQDPDRPMDDPYLIRGSAPKVPGMGFGSIEDVRNSMHVLTGGFGAVTAGEKSVEFEGHMSGIDISAFDPIFWLHHANIDRLFTIWQVLHDDPANLETYVTEKEGGGTWATPGTEGKDRENIETKLLPFYQDGNSFWDSAGVRSTKPFCYAYPETKEWNFQNPKDYRADVIQQLRTTYMSGSLASMIQSQNSGVPKATEVEERIKARAVTLAKVINAEAPNDTATLIKVMSDTSASTPSTTSPEHQQFLAALDPIEIPQLDLPSDRSLAKLAPDNKYLEWMVNIKARKHAMEGNYSVHVFLDNVEEQVTGLWAVAPNHVGTFAPLGQPEDTGCIKCQRDQQDGTNITGQIPLTIALVERYFAGLLESLHPTDVVPYLQKNLHWRVLNNAGRLLSDRSEVDNLLVGVSSNEVDIGTDYNELPRYSPDIQLWPAITTNQQNEGRGNGTGITVDNWHFGAVVAA